MEVRDWVTLVSAAVVFLGWFVNSWLNRKHEIAKKRLEYRMKALESFMPFACSFSGGGESPFDKDPELWEKLRLLNTNIDIYGNAKEQEMMKNLVDAFAERNIDGVKEIYPLLYKCVKKQLRKELNINS